VIQGLILGRDKRVFFFPKCTDYLLGPLILLFKGHLGFSPGLKGLKCETNHLPPPNCKLKEWNYTSTLPMCLHGMDRHTFTFTVKKQAFMYMLCYTSWDFQKGVQNFWHNVLFCCGLSCLNSGKIILSLMKVRDCFCMSRPALLYMLPVANVDTLQLHRAANICYHCLSWPSLSALSSNIIAIVAAGTHKSHAPDWPGN
jgi:hypothetical protein